MSEKFSAPYREPEESEARGEVSLAPLVDTIWRYRSIIALGLAITLTGVFIILMIARVVLPSERIAAISFRVEMEGASRGEYPNHAKFSPNDIIATPVITQVYQSNNLNKYGTFGDFASAFLIENWNIKRDVLAREYEVKLADIKLTAVERSRLEEEFQNKLKALDTPEYRLSFRRSDRITEMPQNLLSKILEDTLATWARQADDRKGALRYNLPVLSGNILNWDAINSEEYLIGIDILRGKVVRVLENLGRLKTLPGADAVRSGPNKLTLAEVQVALEDLLRFKIEPLLGLARTGVSKRADLGRVSVYVENQLFQTQLKNDEATRRVKAIEDSLQAYVLNKGGTSATGGQNIPIPGIQRQGTGETPALIPQFGESFLDRLVQMASKSDDIGYRQKLTDDLIGERLNAAKLQTEAFYYESLKRSLAGSPAAGRSEGGSLEAERRLVEQRLKDAFDQVSWALAHLTAIYDQLSKYNLNPTTMLYTVTLPYTQQRIESLSLRKVALTSMIVMLIAFIVLVIGSLVHHHYRRRPLQTRAQLAGAGLE